MAKPTEIKNLRYGAVFILASNLDEWLHTNMNVSLLLHEKSIRPSFDKGDPRRKTPRNYRWAWIKVDRRVSFPPDTLVIPCEGKMTYDSWKKS